MKERKLEENNININNVNNSNKTNRRSFIGKLAGFGLSAAAVSAFNIPKETFGQKTSRLNRIEVGNNVDPRVLRQRASLSLQIRRDAAERSYLTTDFRNHIRNGDEILYSNKTASFSKTLPHNSLGEVDLNTYKSYAEAVESGDSTAFENITLGGARKLANPQAAFSFVLDGADSFKYAAPAPPKFASEEAAAEIAETYWQSVTRDVAFSDYPTDPTIAEAVTDLNRFARFRGVTASTIFRGETPGDVTGPYISQFLYKPVPYSGTNISQTFKVPTAGQSFMTSYSEWLNIQNGANPTESVMFDPMQRCLRNGCDLGSFVHTDYSFQAYLNAALILLQYGKAALSVSNPYITSSTQGGFVQFGAPHILDMVSRAGLSALKAAWFNKWYMHRRLRPEAMAGRIHNHKTGAANYPINEKILNSPVLTKVFDQNGSYLLPMAYPEGSPTHPAYPAGHATIAGACITILKAFFNEDFVLPSPVVASTDGLSLEPYSGGNLTLGNELNKLAANISIGRDTAGVHWRSDGVEGMYLGEKVAIALLENCKETYNEIFTGFPIRKFDGTVVVVGEELTKKTFPKTF